MSALVFAVMVFAAYRVTRLVTLDTILDRPRDAWWRRFPPEAHGKKKAHPLGYLLTCPFCAGFWVSVATVAASHAVHLARWPLRYDLVVVWAVAGGQALLNVLEERIER